MTKGSELANSFAEILINDASEALLRRTRDRSQRRSRDLVRALFAAIEGLSWLYREHVIDIARQVGSISAEQELALLESSYQVTEQGKISKQARFIPLPSLIRLTTRIATELNPELNIAFDGIGWGQFRKAIGIRNRITHPKAQRDMELSESDVATCIAAFDWILDATIQAMEAANLALEVHYREFNAIVRELEAGDPTAWAEYRAVAEELGH